jgi:excisionase family DNA binding protein
METYLTPEEIAERLKVVPRTVYRWLTTGSLRGVKLGRIWRVDPTDLQNFLHAQSNAAIWRQQMDAALAELRSRVPPEIPDEEIERDITEACEEARAEIYARRHRHEHTS